MWKVEVQGTHQLVTKKLVDAVICIEYAALKLSK